jgi:two-component system response regulator RpfG
LPNPEYAGSPTVLIIDDQSVGRLILGEVIKGIDSNIHILACSNPLEAINHARATSIDLVLTDFKMPQLDGIETIQRLRALFTYEQLPIVMITVITDREIRNRAFEAGAMDFLMRPFDPLECRARCRNLLNLRRQYLINQYHVQAFEARVEQATRALRERDADLARRQQALASAQSGVQTRCVPHYAGLIAQQLGLPADDVDAIVLAAPMHHADSMGIPDSILQNPGATADFLQVVANIATFQFEKFDGSGYPAGLRGQTIPLAARIVALVDVFDALTAPQPHHVAWSWARALNFLVEQKGRHFDPALVDLFLRHADAAERIYQQHWGSQPPGPPKLSSIP